MSHASSIGNRGRGELRFVIITALCIMMNGGGRGLGAAGDSLDQARKEFFQKIPRLVWVAYSPSTFDPSGDKPLLRSDVEADLKALRSVGFTGLVTYSCVPAAAQSQDGRPWPAGVVGTADVPKIARSLGFEGVIAGIWDPESQPEVAAVGQLARARCIDAVCVGNEGLDARYGWTKLCQAMQTVRTSTGLPVTTTEQIEDYGVPGLCDPAAVDWLFPNIHPVFHNVTDPAGAAEWTLAKTKDLRKYADAHQGAGRLPILVKETGWPTQGLEFHTESAQAKFWDVLGRLAKDPKVDFVMFEAFDQPWKHENWQGKDIGTSWGLFSSTREPKQVFSDEVGERLYVYLDENKPGRFIPSGWMPSGEGISQNTAEGDTPHSGSHCIRLYCQLSAEPWVGIYFLLEGKWEPDDPFNAFKALGARAGDSIKCRFWARSKDGATVQFKVGGVRKGRVQDAMVFPKASEWIPLGPTWQRYEIDLTGEDLSSVVGAFVWACDRGHNDNKDVSFDLDTIYFVRTKAR